MDAEAYLSLATLRARLLTDIPSLPLTPSRSDYDLNPATRPGRARQLTPSAVLIPIVARAEPMVLFTKRSESLSRHAGQVSFPGGRVDPDDVSLTATALRELAEETGIPEDVVTVAGFLAPYETITGFAVLPVVGLLHDAFTLIPNTREVDGVFEVPLAFLLDPRNLEEQRLAWKDGTRRVYAFHYESHYIWGATAAILVELRERLT